MKKQLFLGAMLSVALALPELASATDLTFFRTVFNTDFTAAGADGMRGTGTGTINLAGVSGTVTEAYLYWHGPNNNQDNLANAIVNFNGTSVTGTFLGVSDDNCWGFANSLAYRSDVTSLVSGNGAFSLSNFIKGSESEINGVSVYSAESGRRFRANPATPRSPATQGLSCLSAVADFRLLWPIVFASTLL